MSYAGLESNEEATWNPGLMPEADEPESKPRSRLEVVGAKRLLADRIGAAIVTFLPPIAFAVAVLLHVRGWYRIGAIEIGLMLLMQALCLIGVEVGFHRLFSHRSYKANRFLRIALAGLGSMAFQGPVIWWAATHRKHHRYSDESGDPHSPHLHEPGFWPATRQFIHSHIGWIWVPESMRPAGYQRYVMDLYRDPDLLKITLNYLWWLLAGMVFPALLGGLLHGSLQGVFLGFLWGGLVRVFVMNHLTYWCINSVTHSSLGVRPYRTSDRSSNVWFLAIPTLGQSWHNNHHAFPSSSTMWHRWWQLDLGAVVLRVFERLGMASDLRVPNERQKLLRRAQTATASQEQMRQE